MTDNRFSGHPQRRVVDESGDVVEYFEHGHIQRFRVVRKDETGTAVQIYRDGLAWGDVVEYPPDYTSGGSIYRGYDASACDQLLPEGIGPTLVPDPVTGRDIINPAIAAIYDDYYSPESSAVRDALARAEMKHVRSLDVPQGDYSRIGLVAYLYVQNCRASRYWSRDGLLYQAITAARLKLAWTVELRRERGDARAGYDLAICMAVKCNCPRGYERADQSGSDYIDRFDSAAGLGQLNRLPKLWWDDEDDKLRKKEAEERKARQSSALSSSQRRSVAQPIEGDLPEGQ